MLMDGNLMIGRALGSGGEARCVCTAMCIAWCRYVGMCINRMLNACLALRRGGRLSKANHNAILCHRSREKGSVVEEELGTIRDGSFIIFTEMWIWSGVGMGGRGALPRRLGGARWAAEVGSGRGGMGGIIIVVVVSAAVFFLVL